MTVTPANFRAFSLTFPSGPAKLRERIKTIGYEVKTAFHQIFWVSLLLLVSAACLGPKKGLFPPPADGAVRRIFVINQGWHSGIVFHKMDIPDSLWPVAGDFPAAQYIEVGWGDADFYQSPENTIWLGVKALFWPTGTVLHVAGLPRPPRDYFVGYQIVEIELSETGFRQLCRFVQNSYARDDSGQVVPLGQGLYGDSRFYKARGKYLFANTCNNWIARGLRAAGCPVTPLYACTATNVFYQVRKFGKEIQ